MDQLYILHQEYLRGLQISFRRYLLDSIDWTNRLIGIKGARGVGKTTLILQHIFEKFEYRKEALYVSMDNIALTGLSIIEIAAQHQKTGGTHLFIDEIHSSKDWSKELKNIYDLHQSLYIVFTSSSILEINKGQADLSRRVVQYELQGLSFREFLVLEMKENINHYSIPEILEHHIDIAHGILSQNVKPLQHFSNYLHYGYYPFFLENIASYKIKLLNIINLTLDQDLVQIQSLDPINIPKLKKLLHVLSVSVPFQPNISKLAGSIEITRNTLLLYLQYMQNAKLVGLLYDHARSYSLISKPEKIYLHNTNLIYTLSSENANKGNVRETFFLNQVSSNNSVHTSEKGDFLVNEKYTFEIGGAQKNYKQIAEIKNSYLVVDDLEIGFGNKIPLWIFGLTY